MATTMESKTHDTAERHAIDLPGTVTLACCRQRRKLDVDIEVLLEKDTVTYAFPRLIRVLDRDVEISE